MTAIQHAFHAALAQAGPTPLAKVGRGLAETTRPVSPPARDLPDPPAPAR